MSSLFTKIILGEIPCYKIAEDKNNFAFLDINPNSIGHTLCVPKQEVDKLFDLEEERYNDLFSFSRKVALTIRKSVDCKRVGLSVVGLEVPHAHIHLIPLHSMREATFMSKITPSPQEMEATAKKIREKFESLSLI